MVAIQLSPIWPPSSAALNIEISRTSSNSWVWKNQFLREYEDFSFIAEAVASDLASQNIRYAEIFYSPPDFARYDLKTQELTRAIRTGLDRVSEIKVGLVADIVRDFGPIERRGYAGRSRRS